MTTTKTTPFVPSAADFADASECIQGDPLVAALRAGREHCAELARRSPAAPAQGTWLFARDLLNAMRAAADNSAVVRLHNAITDALREMERCPGDSPQDIWNEALLTWETGLVMNHRHELSKKKNANSAK